jgi:hypothetical protein
MAQEDPVRSTSGTAPRKVGLVGYTLPAVVLIVVMIVAVSYWAGRDPTKPPDQQEKKESITSDEPTPGGFNPQPRFGSTEDELKYRGAGSQGTSGTLEAITRIRDASAAEAGRRINVIAEVGEAPGADRFWIQDGTDRVEVLAPAGTPAVRMGDRVSVTGVIELEKGTRRIRAERVSRD